METVLPRTAGAAGPGQDRSLRAGLLACGLDPVAGVREHPPQVGDLLEGDVLAVRAVEHLDLGPDPDAEPTAVVLLLDVAHRTDRAAMSTQRMLWLIGWANSAVRVSRW